MPMRVQFRKWTAADWTLYNPVLRDGEPGYETDTGLVKIGDGKTPWNSLTAHISGGDSVQRIEIGESEDWTFGEGWQDEAASAGEGAPPQHPLSVLLTKDTVTLFGKANFIGNANAYESPMLWVPDGIFNEDVSATGDAFAVAGLTTAEGPIGIYPVTFGAYPNQVGEPFGIWYNSPYPIVINDPNRPDLLTLTILRCRFSGTTFDRRM